MSKKNYRNWQGFLFLLTLAVFFVAFYVQYRQHVEPCPLCLMQRICGFLFGMCCLVALRLTATQWMRRVTYCQMVFAFLGIYFAVRQLWLQSLPPDHAPACLPALDVMIRFFPWRVVMHTLLWGAGSCSEITWLWCGLSMAAWSFVYFLLLFGVSCVLLWRLCRVGKLLA